MILEVLERPDAGCLDVARIIRRSHERRPQQRIFGREAKAMVQSLLDAGIVEIDPESRRARIHVDLQEDFSLHHALSLWLIDTVPRLELEGPTYALDLLTLVESILEDPEFVLRQQLEVLKREKLAELKMAGVEYEQRIEELEKLEHPKPLREFVYGTFNDFARAHPWVRGDDVRPKSVAREMVERFMDFNEYVREYELGRAEGTLLRYLSDVYKALVQTVPMQAKTAEVDEMEVFLRAMVRAVDSSLLDEWERMRTGADTAELPRPAVESDEPAGEADVTRDERGFLVLVRNAMFQLLRALARRDWAGATALVGAEGAGADGAWTAERLEGELRAFFAEHKGIRLDPAARSPEKTQVKKRAGAWDIVQVVSDDEGNDDWALACTVLLDESAREGKPHVLLRRVSR
jgi:hypothetical protein